jgi:hypothetical protein
MRLVAMVSWYPLIVPLLNAAVCVTTPATLLVFRWTVSELKLWVPLIVSVQPWTMMSSPS